MSKSRIWAFAILLVWFVVACSSGHSPGDVAEARSKAKVKLVCLALDSFRQDNERLPEASHGLEALLGKEKYLKGHDVLVDGWGGALKPIVSEGVIVGASSVGPGHGDIRCRVDGVQV